MARRRSLRLEFALVNAIFSLVNAVSLLVNAVPSLVHVLFSLVNVILSLGGELYLRALGTRLCLRAVTSEC